MLGIEESVLRPASPTPPSVPAPEILAPETLAPDAGAAPLDNAGAPPGLEGSRPRPPEPDIRFFVPL
jgi:hypothetical protein